MTFFVGNWGGGGVTASMGYSYRVQGDTVLTGPRDLVSEVISKATIRIAHLGDFSSQL